MTNVRRRYALLWTAFLLLAGCTKEPLEMPGGPDDELTEITLTPESMGDVAMETRAVSGVDENKVSDLWVIQLNSSGTDLLQAPQYISTVTASGTSYSIKAKIKVVASQLYFIANTHNSTLYNGATTSVGAIVMNVTSEAGLASEGTLPMAGYFSGTPTVDDLKNITLKRAVAKLTFKLASSIASNCSFALTSVKVYNVPKVLYPYRDPSNLDPGTTTRSCYPATSVGFTGEFADLTPSNKSLSSTAKDCGWCYLPENGRGTGTATDQRNKTAITALTGQGNYATYVDVRGRFSSPKGTFDLSYRIYLGADAVKDYNVKRNTHYIVTATIRGADELDARIITN